MTDSHHERSPCDPAVFDALEDGLLVVNDDRKVSWYNPALARTLGIQQDNAIGMDVRDLFGTYLLPTFEDEASARLLRQALENGADLPAHLYRARTPDGIRRWLSITGKPVSDEQRLIKIRDATADLDAHHFRVALDQSPVVIFAQDTDLRYTWSYNQQLGFTDTSIIGMRDEDTFPDSAAFLTALKRRVLETGETVRAAVTFPVTGDQRIRDLTLKPLRNAEGRITGVTGIAFDVTERNRVEEALREKTHELKKRMDELRCLYTISHLVEVPGITLETLLQAVADTLPLGWQYPDDTAVRIIVYGCDYWCGDPVETPWKQSSPIVVHGVQVGKIEVRYISDKPVRAEGPFLPEEQMLLDSITRRLGRIIERLHVEEALEKSEEMFRGIAQRSFDMICTYYHDRGITYVSPAVERILGYAPEEMVGTEWEDYILTSSIPAWERGRRKVSRGEQVERLQAEVRRKDGETVILELNESPIVEKGAIVGFQAIGRDISERILYERLREQAFDMTERNIAQFAILADHVRHPLQVVMGVADLLDDEETAEKLREQVRRINMQINRLDREWMESRKIREFVKRYEL
ncbi:MAG: histidine kinase [Methanomicrobiales archaeon HGW-Methanomicrobiales-6]|jgi:PAS domain S-box-containing protein|nr:MAG: histidine kinase [Methanomicrobiales archaeon HGW-Methanomicrobiales-6]